ncbi:MAG: sugar phosphate isomerase/epimerase [Spirochaetales bacterium]|nr:sugar phosphate isomerase/epimerase [Spirochaetales bacterium]
METKKLAVASWSVRDLLATGIKGFIEFADFLVENYIRYVELNNLFIPYTEWDNIVNIFRERKIIPVILSIDGADLFQKRENNRQRQFDYLKRWIDCAAKSSIPSVRISTGQGFSLFNGKKLFRNFIATFRPVLDYCEARGIKAFIENHFGKSLDADFLAAVHRELNSSSFGILLDTGNFKPRELIYENMEKLKNSISFVHAKAYQFDEEGNETSLDYRKIIKSLRLYGYGGHLSVEYEGHGQQLEGVKKTISLLRRILSRGR